MTLEPTLNIDDNIILDFSELEQQKGNASASIDYLPSRISNDLSKQMNILSKYTLSFS